MAERRRLVVTGAAGFIGGAVARHFAASGWDVRALARTPALPAVAGVTHVPYTLEGPPPAPAFSRADAVVHCAYARGNVAVNVTAAERLLAVSRAGGVARNVFLSSLSAKPGAPSAYGRQKLAIERLFSGAGDTVLRAGLVIGAGGLFRSIHDHLAAGRPVPVIGRGRQPVQIIALGDLVRAVETVIDRGQGGLYHVAHPDALPYKEFYRALGAAVGVRPRFVWVPYHVLSAALGVAGAMHLTLPVDRDNLIGLRAMSVADTRQDLARLALVTQDLQQALGTIETGGR